MLISKIMPFLGIGAWLFMALGILTGRHIIKAKLSVHKALAAAAIIVATVHGLIVIYLTYF